MSSRDADAAWHEMIDARDARILELESQLAEARNSGLDEAAYVADEEAQACERIANRVSSDESRGPAIGAASTAISIAAAIRSLKSQDEKGK